MSNIVDVVGTNKSLVTMLKSMKATGLEEKLSKTGPYTLFAPSEIAFGKLAGGELAELLKPENRIKLTSILNNHIIEGKKSFKDLKDGQKLKTLDGKELDVTEFNGKVAINGATVQGRDMEATNGVVHSLDTVLDKVVMSNKPVN